MRFTRDKRGYENTYVVHAERRRGRSRTRILYWFRTPPGVKVGRSALDDDALRRIERQNPDLEFDWPRILKGGGAPPPEPRPSEPRRFDKNRSGVRPHSRIAPPPPNDWGQTPVQPPAPPETMVQRPEPTEQWGQTPEPAAPAAPNERGLTPVEALPAEGTPAHEKLGQEGVLRLRQRYADVRARVLERANDPARRAELLATTERLNPDAWTTADEVASALEQYESVLAALREVVGRKRRRRKRGGRRVDGGGAEQPSAQADATADASDDESDDSGDADNGGEDDPGSGNR